MLPIGNKHDILFGLNFCYLEKITLINFDELIECMTVIWTCSVRILTQKASRLVSMHILNIFNLFIYGKSRALQWGHHWIRADSQVIHPKSFVQTSNKYFMYKNMIQVSASKCIIIVIHMYNNTFQIK